MPKILALALFLVLLPIAPAFAEIPGFGDIQGISPYWDWKTIETENFRISFPADLAPVAEKAANFLEEAHAILSPRLYWKPYAKAQVLVIDNADAANGLTSAQLRFGMILQVTAPDNWFSTAYYDHWLRLLVIHEYTHFLNMDATTSFWVPVRYLFGDVFLPNAFWPSWMLEGLAVYMETRFTRAGRGRSPYYDRIIRAAAEENALGTSRFSAIDQFNGPFPYYPGGESVYLFGYDLMNQVAAETAGNELGKMSIRSSARIPYFINGNLDNITGKDWYGYFKDFVARSYARAEQSLKTIRSLPVTPVEKLMPQDRPLDSPDRKTSAELTGLAISPDGRWAAYALSSTRERTGLYLRELATGKERRITDKLLGVGLAFTPDSRALAYSTLYRRAHYYLWSDLSIYDLGKDSITDLTDSLRARDPDISRDGKRVVFTITERAVTGIALGELERTKDTYRLARIDKIFMPEAYDRASTPKFSGDGQSVIFTLHRDGELGEELVSLDLGTKKLTTLVSNGAMNRFPAIAPDGRIFFISDHSGVDNIFRIGKEGHPEMVSNLTTGAWFPAFGPNGDLYATVFSYTGSELARVRVSADAIPEERVTLSPPPAPKEDELSRGSLLEKSGTKAYEIRDYSAFPSIWPRAWLPAITIDSMGTGLSAFVEGFDALDMHRYLAILGYQTYVKKPEWALAYTNRSLGPALSVSGSEQTTAIYLNGMYDRTNDFSASASYPFMWTYSQLTPRLTFGAQQIFRYLPGANPSNNDIIDSSVYVPTIDGLLTFSNLETSRLAIAPEEGRFTQGGARTYLTPGGTVWKGLFIDREYLRVGEHAVLTPSFKAAASSVTSGYLPADVVIQGRSGINWDSAAYAFLMNGAPLSGFSLDNFDQLTIRGYPYQIYYAHQAGVASLDFQFPFSNIYRGWGTNPVFLENLYGLLFAESAIFPGQEPGALLLGSAGGALRLSTEFFLHVPLIFSMEYHQGFATSLGGSGDIFFQLLLGNIQF